MSISSMNEEVTFLEEYEDTDNDSDSRIHQNSELEKIKKVVVINTAWTTATILDQIIRDNIQLNYRLQRRDAWDITTKSRFIESLMLGFPIPQIVLASQKGSKKFIVLDGKQRLLTILQFYGRSETYNNGFALENLEFRTDINGKNYEDLKNDIFFHTDLDHLDRQTIPTIMMRNVESENLLYKIFLRFNVQTTPLSAQEFRQALHPGEFTDFLDDQSIKSQALKKIFKSPNPDVRMRDVELLLRFVGFHYFIFEYRGNLKAFLDMTCQKLNQDWHRKYYDVENVVNQFEEAVQTTINIFGERNFARMWLSDKDRYQRGFNKAILDMMLFYFADEIIRESAEKHKQKVVDAFKQLCSYDSTFKEAVEGTTQNIRKTYNRLRLWGETLLAVLDVEFNLPELVENQIIFNGFR